MNNKLFYVVALIVGFGVQSDAIALELKGLIINNTNSPAGYQFYRSFSTRWHAQSNDQVTNLVIHERAAPRSGAVIWIELDSDVVFQSSVNPGRTDLLALSESACNKVMGQVSQRRLKQLLTEQLNLSEGTRISLE